MREEDHISALTIPREKVGRDLDPAVSRAAHRDRALSMLGAVAVHAALGGLAILLADSTAPRPEAPVVFEMIRIPAPLSAPDSEAAVADRAEPTSHTIEDKPAETIEPPPAEPVTLSPPEPTSATHAALAPPPKPRPKWERPLAPKPEPAKLRPVEEPASAPPNRPAESDKAATPAPAPPMPSVAAPSAPSAPFAAATAASADYAARLVAWLQRYKAYPRAARLRRIEGRIVLRLALAPDGKVRSATLERASGEPLLDRAALDMVQRADPMPPLPATLSAGGEFLVPVAFTLGPS